MANPNQLPPNVQEKITRFQQLQNTMQQLLLQKQRLELELNESDRALKTLEEVSNDVNVYKSAGAIMVVRKKEDVVKELNERREFLEMRSKVLAKQENNTRERLTQVQESLQKELSMVPSS